MHPFKSASTNNRLCLGNNAVSLMRLMWSATQTGPECSMMMQYGSKRYHSMDRWLCCSPEGEATDWLGLCHEHIYSSESSWICSHTSPKPCSYQYSCVSAFGTGQTSSSPCNVQAGIYQRPSQLELYSGFLHDGPFVDIEAFVFSHRDV